MPRGSARALLLIALTAAGLGAVASASAASAAMPDPDVAAIENWTPPEPGDWTSGDVTVPLDGEAFPGCDTGSFRFHTAVATDIQVTWRDCGDVDNARTSVGTVASVLGLIALPDADTTLLDGDRVVALRPGFGAVFHLWAQGRYVLSVIRYCGYEDPEACRASADSDAVDLATTLDAPVAQLDAGLAADADPFASWVPRNGPWTSAPDAPPVARDDCTPGATRFTADGDRVVIVNWADCPDARAALLYEGAQWTGSNLDARGAILAFGGFRDTSGLVDVDGRTWVTRHWVQGERYLAVATACGDDVALCTQDNVFDARSLGIFAGGVVAQNEGVDSLLGLVLLGAGVPLLTFVLIHVPRRIVARLRTSGYRTDSPGFVDVGPDVRRALRSRTLRRVIVGLAVVIAYVVAIFALVGAQTDVVAFGIVLFIGPLALTLALHLVLLVAWRGPALLRSGRMRQRPSAAGAAGLVLRAIAFLLAVGALEAYALTLVTLSFGAGRFGGDLARAQLEAAAAAGDPLAVVQLGLLALQGSGLIVVGFFLVLALPITAAYLIDRLGRRLGRASLADTLAADTRPYFLYLRGFDEDRLRVDESLGRRGLIELLAPFGRPRFEEVVVEHLTTAGPVIAIAGGRERLRGLGAAKATLGDDEWRDRVTEWVGGARAVVMSATPSEVRAGLQWEIEHLATRDDAPPIILMLAPWPRAELRRRWEGFVDAVRFRPRFRELADLPPADGVHVAVWTREHGWRAYGARRRWDWSYAASLRRALESGDL